jgi:hypothetical protein
MAVEQVGVQLLFQSADLATDGRLRQIQLVARMGQAARVRHGVKYSELVPIHEDYLYNERSVRKNGHLCAFYSLKTTLRHGASVYVRLSYHG